METWHARWGGNSNKRLMGHGAFSTAAKYPPLLTPPLCAMLAEGVRHFKTQAPTLRRHISATPLPQFYWAPWAEMSGQHDVSFTNISHEPHVPGDSVSHSCSLGSVRCYVIGLNLTPCYSSDGEILKLVCIWAGLQGCFRGHQPDKFSHYLEKTRAAQRSSVASGGGDLTTVTQHQIRQQGLGKDRERIHTEVHPTPQISHVKKCPATSMAALSGETGGQRFV